MGGAPLHLLYEMLMIQHSLLLYFVITYPCIVLIESTLLGSHSDMIKLENYSIDSVNKNYGLNGIETDEAPLLNLKI